MNERVFIDTSILIYADDFEAGEKHVRAVEVLDNAIRSHSAVFSTQVLQEFYVTATRKLGVAHDLARRKVELLAEADVIRISVDDILRAVDLSRLRSFSFWDALIVQCAARSGCGRILTEDLQHGQKINGVTIENPLRGLD